MKLTARVAFADLKVKWTWRPIPGCPGRFVLVTDNYRLPIEDVAGGDVEIESYRVRGARDEVLVARLEGGGILSYRRADGTCVHTLNTPEGLARKLGQLGIDPSA